MFARTASRHDTVGSRAIASGIAQLHVQLSRTMLLSNTAMRGNDGAVNIDGGHLIISDGTRFLNNTAAADGGGFAIYAASGLQSQPVNKHSRSSALQSGCSDRWEQGMAILVISQRDTAFEGNTAARAGGAGYIGEYVLCNTTAVLSLRELGTVPNAAASSSLVQTPGTCEAGFYWTSAGVCAKCSYGTYRLLNATDTDNVRCEACPTTPGYHCPGGDIVRPLPHYWMPDYTQAGYASKLKAAAPAVYWCPGYEACPGCSFNCSRGYTGHLCSECDAGFNSPTPFKCKQCSAAPVGNLILSTAATIGVVYVLWIVAWRSKPGCFFSAGDVLKQVSWFFQVLVIVIRSSEAAWADFALTFLNWVALGFAQGELGSVPAMQCLVGKRLTALMPWGLWRGILSAAFIVAWIFVLIAAHVLVVGLLAKCGVKAAGTRFRDARGVRDKFKWALNFLGVAVGLDNSFQAWGAELWGRLRMLVYVALAHFYPVLLRISLGSFICIGVEGQQLWSIDMSMTCWTGAHLFWVIFMGVAGVIILVCIVPVNLAVLEVRMYAAVAAIHDDTEGLTALGKLQQYLFGAYRERCKAWEGVLQIRLVLIVLISVASPRLGPYYTLILFGSVLAAFIVWHDMQKPYKDLCLQQLQALAYFVLVINVVLGMVAMTANTRPGPRSAHNQQELQINQAAMQQHCPDQLAGETNVSKTVLAASILMIIASVFFVVVALLILLSLWTRGWRGKGKGGQLLQLADRKGQAPVWMLGLGLNDSSTFGVPVVHAGHWTEKGQAEQSTVVPHDAQPWWVTTALLIICRWLIKLLAPFWWWPAAAQHGRQQQEQQGQPDRLISADERQIQQQEGQRVKPAPVLVGELDALKKRGGAVAADVSSSRSSAAMLRTDDLKPEVDQA